ncbi:IclR family transcriptional regulator C-terminal domain-containing protein [Streptomyces sp. SID12488]|uniref:IclR family transcriptional regulator n=1 Tax=Streptomyces sp. SID12488 TaxID=2706040 RepID=UPI001EF26784|nr:IclR family transcriptional regulator C-terminal domain-containing protein [Streptomyces sp. SID12488]
MVDTAPAEPQAPPVQRRPEQRTAPSPRNRDRLTERSVSAPVPALVTVPPGESHPTATLIGSVQRAMRLLESVAAHEHGAPAKQLARETGLALPTAYHLLRTLVFEGYLRREKGLFFLGEAAERLGSSGARQKRRSTVVDALAHWRDAIGVPVYYAVYRDGEIEVMCVSDTPGNPAVEEWADFRETGHAHAIGQCLLSQLDEQCRRDHLDRHPVQAVTPYTVRDSHTLLRRLDRMRRMELVVERQEYALGTVCAAVPITIGSTAATLAISLPSHQADRLLVAAQQLQAEVGRLLGSLAISISI